MTNKSRIRARERAIQRKRKEKFINLSILIVGILVLFGGYIVINGNKPTELSITVDSENINSDYPLRAIHEMDGPSLSSIAFLPKNQPQPKVAVSESTYSFGVVGVTEKVSRDFVIQNIGDGTLTISRAYTTCGCTIADFTSTVIPPGEHAIMTLVFDAGYHDAAGQSVRRGIIIENNDPDLPQLEIWISATVANN